MDILDPGTGLWPPSYLVKKHPWARRIKLRASIQHGLEVIVPRHFNLKDLPRLLEKNRLWIEKQLLQLEGARQAGSEEELPTLIYFKALDRNWNLYYVAGGARLALKKGRIDELIVVVPQEDKEACKKLLVRWIKKQAKVELLSQLEQVSLRIGIPYNKAMIRGQTTRWGSCTSKKSISLNYKLLFFPKELMLHVMIHELCHTIHMNHSAKFWHLVAQHDLHWREHRRLLRKAQSYIPSWLS